MARRDIAICPTLGAVEAISRYRGWDGTADTAPARITTKQEQMRRILRAQTPLCLGSDVGVFDHGDNAWELELMAEYGVTSLAVLRAATSGNAGILHLENEIGAIAQGFAADIIAVSGNPLTDLSTLHDPTFVMQAGNIIHQP